MIKKYELTDMLIPNGPSKNFKERSENPEYIIIHTPGWGLGLQKIVQKFKKDLKSVQDRYARRLGVVLVFKGQFMVGWSGTIYQFFEPDKHVAYHTGSKNFAKLKKLIPPEWWCKRWPMYKNPTEMGVWKTESPNEVSIGIDLLTVGHKDIPETYTDEQYANLANLVWSLCNKYNIPMDREHILGHEDVDWIARGNPAPWDPGKKFDWDRFMGLLNEETNDVKESLKIEDVMEEPIAGEVPEISMMPRGLTAPGHLDLYDNPFVEEREEAKKEKLVAVAKAEPKKYMKWIKMILLWIISFLSPKKKDL